MMEFAVGADQWRYELTDNNHLHIERLEPTGWELHVVGTFSGESGARVLNLAAPQGKIARIERSADGEYNAYLQPISTRVCLGKGLGLCGAARELIQRHAVRLVHFPRNLASEELCRED